MQQTVLNTTQVKGVSFLYYFAYATAVASGVFCILFLGLLFNNYFAPYSPEKLDEMIRRQEILDQEAERKKAETTPQSEQAAPQAAAVAGVAEDDSEEARDAASTGQRPDIDPAQLESKVFSNDPKIPFLLLPSDYKELVELRHQLAQETGNQELRNRIRQLDQQLRIEYFRRKEIAASGAPFLMIAAIVFLFAARIAAVLNRKIPVPRPDDPQAARRKGNRLTQLGLIAVLLGGALCVGISVGLIFSERSDLETFLISKLAESEKPQTPDLTIIEETVPSEQKSPAEPSQVAKSEPPTAESQPTAEPQTATPTAASTAQPPTEPAAQPAADSNREAFLAKWEKNWPGFRGPDGSGIARFENIPTTWDFETGEGIVWKTDVPLPGHNSPILWENRVFLSGADSENRKVFCFDAEKGTLLWECAVPEIPRTHTAPLELGVDLNEDTGFAAPTMTTDGERVYAIFANLDLIAVDFEGKLVWAKNLGLPDNHYGYSASLGLYFDRIIVQYDQGDGRKEGESKLFAFRGTTGEIVWETPRTMMSSWPSPIVRKVGERWQILTGADPWLVSYDPESGKELWRCKAYGGGDTAASPTALGTIVFAANAMPGITAINGTAEGDLTKTDKVLWKESGARPDACSPLAVGNHVFSLGQGPYMQCIDIEKGIMIWELEVDENASFYSSPGFAGGKIYLFDKYEDGAKAYVIDPSKAVLDSSGTALKSGCEKEMILATPAMPEPIFASPAFAEGRIYIRGPKGLYCIGK